MAESKRGNDRNGSRRSGRSNNRPDRKPYSGIRGTARQNPLATAAAVGGAVAAGVFLWSRRNQISDQIGNLSEQITDWREGMGSDGPVGSEDTVTSGSQSGGRTQTDIAQEALTLKEIGRRA